MLAAMDVGIRLYYWLAAAPYAAFAGIWAVMYLATRNPQICTRVSMDLTFWLLIGSVSAMLRKWTGSAWLLWLSLFVLLVAAGRFGRQKERKNGDAKPLEILKWTTRSGFLVLTALYAILLLFQLALVMSGG